MTMFRRMTATAIVALMLVGCNSPNKSGARDTSLAKGTANKAPKGSDQTAADKAADAQPAKTTKHKLVVKEDDYANGKPAERTEGYNDADGNFVRNGERDTWYENGQKKMEMHYKDGLADGPRITWYDTGQMWGRGAYNHGREDGVWTAWYANGFKFREWTMHNGAFDGTFMQWHDNGEVRFRVDYVHGLKQGPAIWYDEAGNEISRTDYVDDVAQPAAAAPASEKAPEKASQKPKDDSH